MAARLFSGFALLFACCSLASAFEPGDLVVARRDVPILNSGQKVDQIGPGQVLAVVETDGAKLRVSRGRPGWIDAADAIALRDAETFFSKPFATGAGARDYLSRGTVRLALEKHDEGIADLKKAVEMANEPGDYLESLGYAQLAANQQPAAIETFSLAIHDQPDSAPALMGRGLAYYQVGQNQNAYRDLFKAIELQPQHAFPRKYVGALLHDLGKLDRARTQLDFAVKLDPYDVFIRKALGRLLFDQGDYEAALGEFNAATRLDAKDIEAVAGRGVVQHAIGIDLASAEADFITAIKLVVHREDHAFLWSNLGQVQIELGKFPDAKTNLDKAIELEPNFNEARSHRAWLIAERFSSDEQLIERAKNDLKKVMASQEPRTFWVYQAVARVNMALGNYSGALTYQRLAFAEVKKSGPPRFVAIAEADLKRYASNLSQVGIKR